MDEKNTLTARQGKHRRCPCTESIVKWLLLVAIIILSVTIALILNQKYEDNTAEKLIKPLSVDINDDKTNWNNYPTTHIDLSESLNITESGTFYLTGALEDGMIVVDNPGGSTRLVLDNVVLRNNSGPVILGRNVKDFVIEIVGENSLIDGQEYSEELDSEAKGVVSSDSNLTFLGEGTLNIVANYQDAIVSKDNLKILSGTYVIDSVDDGIRGNDSVQIKNGNFIINSVADAIKATNSTDVGMGYILIEGGNFSIKSTAKGFDSHGSTIIRGGDHSIETFGDAIHSEDNIGVTNASINISSGDDAIHARHELVIDSGNINVVKSLEGLEARAITINGGNLNISSLDDGINTAIHDEESQSIGYIDVTSQSNSVTINDGNIYINAEGDGIDSNEWIFINGGNTIVDGPTNGKNGAIDATMGVIMNGGRAFAVGDSGMAGTLGNTSSIYNVSIYLDSVYPKDTRIKIQNEAGDVVFEHVSAKSFNHIAAGSPDFNLGGTYQLFLDEVEYRDFVVFGNTTKISSTAENPLYLIGDL